MRRVVEPGAVATGVFSLREAAEKLPVSVTAMTTDITSKRSICQLSKIEKSTLHFMVAEMASRVRWASFVTRQAEKRAELGLVAVRRRFRAVRRASGSLDRAYSQGVGPVGMME